MGTGLTAGSKVLERVMPRSLPIRRAAELRREVYPRLIAKAVAEGAQEWIQQSLRYTTEVMTDLSLALLGDAQAILRNAQRTADLMRGQEQFIKDRLQMLKPPEQIEGWEVGKNLGPSRGQEIYDSSLLSLKYFPPPMEMKPKGQILLVASWVNRAVILDLTKDRSMVKELTEKGYEVFITDWKEVTKDNSESAIFDCYVQQELLSTFMIQELRRVDKIDALGYCIGGMLINIAAARWPDFYNGLINLAVPTSVRVGEEGGGQMYALTNQIDPSALCQFYNGVIPGFIFTSLFDMAHTGSDTKIMRRRVINFCDRYIRGKVTNGIDEIKAWNILTSQGVGWAQVTFLKIMGDDLLAQGRLKCLGERVHLENINHRLLSIFSDRDHIVHPDSVMAISDLIGTPKEEQYFVLCKDCGHLEVTNHPDVYQCIIRFLDMDRVDGEFENRQYFSDSEILAALTAAKARLKNLLGDDLLPFFTPGFQFPRPSSWAGQMKEVADPVRVRSIEMILAMLRSVEKI